MVEGGGLENRCRFVAYLGFESLVHRHIFKTRMVVNHAGFFMSEILVDRGCKLFLNGPFLVPFAFYSL